MWYPARCRSCRKAFTLVELLVVLGIIVVLLSILLPVIARARERAHAVKCASNMRQIYMACIMYADMLGKLPIPGEPSPTNHGFEPGSCCAYGNGGLIDFEHGSLWDFLGSSKSDRMATFMCPSDDGLSTGYADREGDRGWYITRNFSYCFNCEMRGPLEPFINEAAKPPPPGIRMTDISRPDRKLLIMEMQSAYRLDFDYMAQAGPVTFGTATPGWNFNLTHRHFGKGNQCFADGHIEMIPPIPYYQQWWAGTEAYEYLA